MAGCDGGYPVRGGRGGVPWADAALAAVAAVSWATVGMVGAAALGLHLLGADGHGSLGPMAAAVTVLAVGGTVTPSGDVSVFGLEGAKASTAVDITPLGVGLVGALLLARVFLRSLRTGGPHLPGRELVARAGMLSAVFLCVVGGLCWMGHDTVTFDFDGKALRSGGDGNGGGAAVPGLGDLGSIDGIDGIGGLLPDRLGDLVRAEASVGFTVNTGDSLRGAAVWLLAVLVVALLASRRAPLPRGWGAVQRTVRPAASALVTVLLVAVAAGAAAAGYAAAGDDRPGRICGAALLGTPNGVWLGVLLGLFVPWDGTATGGLAQRLPDPLDELLRVSAGEPVTLTRLAALDGKAWLLAVACAAMMLYAGVLTAVRTPRAAETGVVAFAVRCAVPLGLVTAGALLLLVFLTEVSAEASLSVLGVDALGAGIDVRGRSGTALVLGAVWGTGAGCAGALLAWSTGAAGRRASAQGATRRTGEPPPGPYRPSVPYRPPNPDTNPYLRMPEGWVHGAPTIAGPVGPLPPVRRPRPPRAEPDASSADQPSDGPPPPGTPGTHR
ncbi:streptophobe family protein [Streptomyces sp. NPDC059175]|uniref:streptophobe family protein n=1 Tax=unclassified Streptomyces TaxID=2593676 RepID=UPI0036BF7EEE